MPTCLPPGWGSTGWGWSPWGGGGPLQQDLPTHPPFDVYCVGPCEEISHIFQFFLVSGSANLNTDPLTGNLLLDSGGTGAQATEEWLEIQKAVPSIWTLECTVKFQHLPPKLTSMMQAMGRVWIGVWNEQGASAGLFFSAAGIGYAAHQDDPIIPIPDSNNIVNELDYWTIRMVGNVNTGALFVYITKSSDLDAGGNHILRFVLPVPAQTGSHQEHTYISVLGTPQIHNMLELQSICLATGPVVPNMPPIADAGNEQEVKLCTIGQLDGTASYDPEGAPITYFWRLTDAPVTSKYCYEGYDGWTGPDPSGFTNELHTRNNLNPATGGWEVKPGDVLVTKTGAYTIQQVVTTDPLDQVVQISGYNLAAGEQFPHYFKIVRQLPLYDNTSAKPTFYPDAPGFWRFDLVVSDGQLYSEPAVVTVSVKESPVPRGCTPDLSFVWGYLSDFWQLVEGKEPITAIWSAVAQIVASELMKLWQVDYNKSLRDIQRTMVRKWLYYDLLIQEPFPDLTRCPCLPVPKGFLSGSNGQVLPAQPPAPWPPLPLPLQVNPYGYRTNTRLDDKGVSHGDLLVLNGNAYRIDKLVDEPSGGPPDVYKGELVLLDPIYDVPPTGPLPVIPDWSIVKPVTSQQIDFWGGLVVGGGQSGDDAIIEVLDKKTGGYQFFKSKVLGVCEQLPNGLAVDPTEWSQFALDTTGRYELYFVAVFRRHYVPINDRVRDIPYLQNQIRNAPIDEVLHRNVDFFLERFRDRACIRFADVWKHTVLDTTQNPPVTIWADDPTPPARLWAEFTYIENLSVVESNFGKPAGLTVEELERVDAVMPGDIDYLSAVRGLWYVHFNTPSPRNMRIGSQILLGLPFAEEDGVITKIIPNLNESATRLLVTDKGDNGIVRAYDYPDGLSLETNPSTGQPYKEGDEIAQFAPISTGVDVLDWVKDPYWISPYVDQCVMYEVHKYFYFPVVIEKAAFSLAGVSLIQKLILDVKPSYTYPIIVLRFKPDRTDIDVEEQFSMLVTMTMHEAPCTHYEHSHPHMWGAGDTGPITFFPSPETTTSDLYYILHRHENYPGWFSSCKSQYGKKNYPDVGYFDYYAESVNGVTFPFMLPTMPLNKLNYDPTFVQAEPYSFTVKALYIEITPATTEPAPVYTIELLHDGAPLNPPVRATFTITLQPGETTFHTTISFLFQNTIPGDKPMTARLTVGPGGSGATNWTSCRFQWLVTYKYESPNWWGYYGGSNQAHPWPSTPPDPPYGGADMLCPEASLEFTTYMQWSSPMTVQYNTIFIFGEPVYPAYVDTNNGAPEIVVDWSSPTHSVPPGSGQPGWSFGQVLDPPPSPYTGYVSKKSV